MGPKTLKASRRLRPRAPSEPETKPSTKLPATAEIAVVGGPQVPEIQQNPRFPQEIIDEILDHLVANWGWDPYGSLQKRLKSFSLVSKSWIASCRRHLFHTIVFEASTMEKWLKAFPVPEQSPAHHVRNMCLSVGGYYVPPGEFFRRIQWFTNVKKVTVQGKEMFDGCLEIPLYAKVPQSVTSLTIEARVMGLELMRDVVVQLPDLDHSSQSGSSTTESRKSLRRLGAAIRVGFGGRPRLRDESTDDEVLNMLLEVPNDLHLTEVCVYADRDCHLSTVKLAKAGRKAFAMLSYGGSIHGHSEAFDQPFNFSKFSRLEEVSFDIHWVHRDLQWIPLSLATLKPETSPRLSKIYLSFSGPAYYYHSRGMGTALEESANKIAHELTRIEDEYGGAADLIVALDAAFTQLDAVDVLRRWEPSD